MKEIYFWKLGQVKVQFFVAAKLLNRNQRDIFVGKAEFRVPVEGSVSGQDNKINWGQKN